MIWFHETHFYVSYMPIRKRIGTGKSFSEALSLASTNPQYDKRLFIDLSVQYMKTTSSEHVVYINCFLFLFWHSKQFMYTTCSELVTPVTPINKMKPKLNKFLFSTARPQYMWPLGVRTLQISSSELDLKFSRYSDTWILHGFWVFSCRKVSQYRFFQEPKTAQLEASLYQVLPVIFYLPIDHLVPYLGASFIN